MPQLEEHQSNETTKIIVLGDSGAGKSGMLAGLAHAGYNVRVMDYDNGLDVLKNMLMGDKSPYDKSAVKRVHFKTFTDVMRPVGGKLLPSQATAWRESTEAFASWRDVRWNAETKKNDVLLDLGSVLSWTPRDVLVIDSLTLMCEAAFNYVLMLNSRLGQRPEQSDWGMAQDLVLNMLKTLYDSNVKCNVVVNAHIEYTMTNSISKGQIVSLGRALSPKIGRYFNSQLLLAKRMVGVQEQRQLITNSTTLIELKSSAPLAVKASYEITHGLAEYFADVKKAGGFRPMEGAQAP